MKHFDRRLIFIGLIILCFAVIFGTRQGKATPLLGEHPPNWGMAYDLAEITTKTTRESPAANLPSPAKQDPCLHCHIAGEEKGLWTTTLRWMIFGTAGIIFSFGIIRSSTIWKTRAPWKSLITRTAEWIDDRYQISDPLSKILNKPVPQWQRRWWYCLGGLTAFAFVIQGITGIMLAFYYKPTPEAAYASILFIENQVYMGSMIRMIHHWSANFMIVLCIAHMLRVFIMGAFKPPRELNWVSGVILLLVTLGFGFTGYLLPWDQRAFWATTVGTEIAGALPIIGNPALILLRVGWNISDLTLSRFYSLHVIVIPAITIVMMMAHFLMVRKQGIMKPL
jgi:cytochrome b6